MRKNWLKRAVCAGLSAAVAAGLCACGGGGGGVTQDPSLAKQYVYRCQDIELPDLGDDFNIQTMGRVEDRIYGCFQIYHWDEEGDNLDYKMFSLKTDGSDMQQIPLEMPAKEEHEDGGEPGEDGAETGNGGNTSGSVQPREVVMKLTAAVDSIAVPDMVVPIDIDDTGVEDNIFEYTNLYNFSLSSQGVLYGIKNYSYEDYSDPENYINERSISVCAWDMEGKLLWEKKLEEMSGQESTKNLTSAVATDSGSYLMFVNDWEKETLSVMELNGDGEISEKEIGSTAEESLISNIREIVLGKNGQLFLFGYNPKDNYKMYISGLDQASGTTTESIPVPSSLEYNGYRAVMPGISSDLLFSTTEGIFSYNMGDTALTQVMSFVNSDLDSSGMNEFLAVDEDHFVGFYYTRMDYENKMGIFTKVNPEDIPDKKVLMLAGMSLDYEVLHRVVEFNKTSEAYRIVTKEYNNFITGDDYMAGYTQLNSDILAGNMPDILVVNDNMNLDKYVSKGLLADVDKLIQEDEELSQIDFMDNVFEAYRMNGKLYQVIPGFYVRTMVGKKSLLGDRTTWTMQEFMDLMDSLPEGTQMTGELTRSQFLFNAMNYCGSDFVDVSTGKCNFNSENFIKVLEYAASLPVEINWEDLGDDYWSNYESMYRENKFLLQDISITNVEGLNNTLNGSFGEDLAYVGFPTDSGQGSYIYRDGAYAISAKSANVDGAWEFIRYYLTDEYQNEIDWPFPVNEAAFDAAVAKGMEKPSYEDEDGNMVEYEYTYWMNGEEIILPVMTKEQTDQVSAFLKSVTKPLYYNEDIINIVTEEAEAFFTGQKSVQDVVDVIQNRAQVYINENS